MIETEHNRRATDRIKYDSKVRNEIMEQLSEIEDPSYRVMLTIMLKVQDELVTELSSTQLMMQGYMSQIAMQLEKLTRSEDEIKKIALNGHAEHHHSDHEYLRELRKRGAQCNLIVNNHGADGLCEVARKAIEDEEVRKRRQWKIVDDLAGKATLLITGILLATLFPHLAGYFK